MDAKKIYNDCLVCSVCHIIITDEFYLRVGPNIYHESCLQCSICQIGLDEQSTCFLNGVHILCRQDYYKKYFANKCSKCNRYIYTNDWIRRACEYIYHLTCFACSKCGRQLSTDEEYSLKNDQILCKIHLIEDKDDNTKQNKIKRNRTIFTEKQLKILGAQFEINPNPDEPDLQSIAQTAGLNKRATQVWFQNNRARQKKIQIKRLKQKNKHHNSINSSSSKSDHSL